MILTRLLAGRYAGSEPTPPAVANERFTTVIGAIIEHCQASKRRLTWVIIPPVLITEEHLRAYPLALKSILEVDPDADLIDFQQTLVPIGKKRFRYYIEKDAHLNGDGNRYVGTLLAERIRSARQ